MEFFPTNWDSPKILGADFWENFLASCLVASAQNSFLQNAGIAVVCTTVGGLVTVYICSIIFYTMKTIVTIFLMVVSTTCFSQDATQLRKAQFNLDNGIAISGFDPVAYFKQGKAIKGKKELAVFGQGVTYYFSSVENKEEFKKNPSNYEPQYGGWCAYAMGKDGTKVEVDPETFKIIDGKLYLFYNKFFNNTLKSWNKDEANLKSRADVNWKKFYHQ